MENEERAHRERQSEHWQAVEASNARLIDVFENQQKEFLSLMRELFK